MPPIHVAFGPMLKRWRSSRGYSQERLADAAEVSPRHVSFLETGRAAPSREMVLVLASALDLPLRDRNTLLGAAGFAAVYRESDLDSPALVAVRRALQHLLDAQEPHAAFLVDRLWNVRKLNRGGSRLLGWLFGPRVPPPLTGANILHSLFHPEGVRESVVNWEDVAGLLIERLHREIALEPDDDDRRALLRTVLGYPGVPEHFRSARFVDAAYPFVPVQLRQGGTELKFFTTLTTLGTPLDVTAQELRIESYFPADDATESFMRAAAD
jgi:transcriptional regulator with XRE-family HTH domain